MTLQQIIDSTKEMLTPKDVAEVLGCDPYTINVQVRQDIAAGVNSFGFPISKIGTRVRIPRRAFLRFVLGEEKEEKA
jgi:hypothetical protein